MTNDNETFPFYMSICPLIYSLLKCLFKSFDHFKKKLGVTLLLSYKHYYEFWI